jgi:hypothetical protein
MLCRSAVGVRRGVVTRHEGRARRRTQQSRQHLDGGGLAGTVRPEESEDLAPAHGEADIVHRDEAAVHAAQIGGRQ